MRIALACLAVVLLPALAVAQGMSAVELSVFPENARLFYLSGYLSGFTVATALPASSASEMQRCFQNLNGQQMLLLVDSWLVRHPKEVGNPDFTARAAVFSALVEACGWKKR